MNAFSKLVAIECRGTGVTVQNLQPGFVNTDILKVGNFIRRLGGYLVPTPQRYVRHAVDTIGVANNTTGYWVHGLKVRQSTSHI